MEAESFSKAMIFETLCFVDSMKNHIVKCELFAAMHPNNGEYRQVE